MGNKRWGIHTATWAVLALVLFGFVRVNAGRAELQQANQQNPYNIYRMAQAYKGKGDLEQAKAMCQRAATFNALNNLNQAFIKARVEQMLKEL